MCVDRLLVTVIRALLSRLVAATDNNVQGDKYADRLRWRSFERLRSKDVDWKDELRGRVRPLMRIIPGIREGYTQPCNFAWRALGNDAQQAHISRDEP